MHDPVSSMTGLGKAREKQHRISQCKVLCRCVHTHMGPYDDAMQAMLVAVCSSRWTCSFDPREYSAAYTAWLDAIMSVKSCLNMHAHPCTEQVWPLDSASRYNQLLITADTISHSSL